MEENKAFIFVDKSYIKADGTCSVYLKVKILNKYRKYALDINLKPGAWDVAKSQVIKGSEKHELNKRFSEVIGKANNIFLRYKYNNKQITHDLFKAEFDNPAMFQDFIVYMRNKIKQRGELTAGSIRQHKSILRKLENFQKEILFVELNADFLRKFEFYLRNKLNNKTNTIHNALKTIRTYVNMAMKDDIITKSPFASYKLRREKTYPLFLDENEVKLLIDLYNRNYLNNRDQSVLRYFLFCCYTGLRVSDLIRMKHENIKKNLIIIHPEKNVNIDNKRIEIPLTKFAKQLIKDENKHRIKGKVFDCKSEQLINRQLKEIVKIVNIDKNITIHTARHTFATHFIRNSKKANGILILKRLLGHSKLETTLIYAHILNDDLKDAMNDFEY